MRIAITGSHSVGKTTLAERLQQTLGNHYVYLQEPYYELEEKGYLFSATPDADDFVAQLKYSLKLLATEEENAIFDRCPVDLLAYIQALDPALVARLYDSVEEAMATIDLLVYVSIERPDRIECAVHEFPELRESVNEILNEWITDFDLPILEVTGTLAEREKKVLQRLEVIKNT